MDQLVSFPKGHADRDGQVIAAHVRVYHGYFTSDKRLQLLVRNEATKAGGFGAKDEEQRVRRGGGSQQDVRGP